MSSLSTFIEQFGSNTLVVGIVAIFALLSAIEFTIRYLLRGARLANWMAARGSQAAKKAAAVAIREELRLVEDMNDPEVRSEKLRNVLTRATYNAALTVTLCIIAAVASLVDEARAPIWLGTAAGLATRRVFELTFAIFTYFRFKRIMADVSGYVARSNRYLRNLEA